MNDSDDHVKKLMSRCHMSEVSPGFEERMAVFYRQKHLFNETEESEGEENEFYQFLEAPDEFESSPIMPQNNVKTEELKVADNTQKIFNFDKKFEKTNLVEI